MRAVGTNREGAPPVTLRGPRLRSSRAPARAFAGLPPFLPDPPVLITLTVSRTHALDLPAVKRFRVAIAWKMKSAMKIAFRLFCDLLP